MVHGHKKNHQPGRTGTPLTPGSNNSSIENASQSLGGGGGGGGLPSSSSTSNGLMSNSNSLSGGARQTGTVPKTKASRKNSVPQEIVAPTRRDLQQHLTDLVHWASTAPSPTNSTNTPVPHIQNHHHHHHQQQQQHNQQNGGSAAFKRPIRTPGEGTCFDLDNLSLQDHATNSRFIPVRPIVRGSYLSEDLHGEQHLSQGSNSNTTIGVVIPTTPSQQQQQQHHHNQETIDPIWQHIINPLSRQRQSEGRSTAFRIIPDGAPSQPTSSRQSTSSRTSSSHRTGGVNSAANRHLDDRILEIQDYIRATSSLINTINQEKKIVLKEENQVEEDPAMVNDHLNRPINSIHLETMAGASESEENGPRPQSVASIHSTPTPGTPDYDELQHKLQASNRNMQMIKDQQNQILRLQQAAKDQLEDMEKERSQHATSNLLTQEEPPNYENVAQVQDDVSGLINRMRSLTTFIENQNNLATMLGEDLMTDEILAEQSMLQKKLQELKSKRGQMAELVNELQSMNNQADQSFSGDLSQNSSQMSQGGMEMPVNQINRIVPMSLERIVPIEMISDGTATHAQQQQHPLQTADSGASLNSQGTLVNCNDLESEGDHNDYESESMASRQMNSVVADKLAEITAMKEQLKRLQNMMTTVQLIEDKVNGPDPVEMAQASLEVDRLISEIPQVRRNVVIAEKPQMEEEDQQQPQQQQARPAMDSSELEPVLSERVQALHAMTADLRVQALSLAAERDRLRTIKDEMIRRKVEEQEERESENSNSTIRETVAGAASLNYNNNREASEQRKLNEEFELKKREYETVLEKMQNVGRRSQPPQLDIFGGQQESVNNGLSKKMQNDQMGFNGHTINSVPWRRQSSSGTGQMTMGLGPQQQLPTQQQMSASIAQLQNHQTMFQQQTSQTGGSNYGQQQEQGMFLGSNSVEGGGFNYRGDSLLLQQFIQTQQMLINSISQCNQLLWAQQRELNNLNNAVLMLQERLLKHELSNTVQENSLNMSGQNLMNNRSESVPPSSVGGLLTTGASNLMHQGSSLGNQVSYMRAQSEQPSQVGPFYGSSTSSANFGNAPQTTPIAVRFLPTYNNQSMLRNGNGHQQSMQANPNNSFITHLNNNLANNNTNNLNNNLNQFNNHHQQANNNLSGNNANLNNITNNLSNNRIARVTGNVQMPNQMQQQQQSSNTQNGGSDHQLFGNNILNLNPLNNNLSASMGNSNLDHLPPIHHHFGGHHPGHNLQHLMNHSQQLNNQVTPGNRANNYWDNFRSYSRQNLLSGNSCKSNEESCASSTSNYQQPFVSAQQQQQHHQPPQTNADHPCHRVVPTFHIFSHPNQQQQQLHQSSVQQVLNGKGFQQHYRNTLLDLHQHHTAAGPAPDCGLNNNAYPPSQNLNNNNLNNIVNNLCRTRNNLVLDNSQHIGGDMQHGQTSSQYGAHGTSFPATNMTQAAEILGFHTNPINLGVNEFAAKSKTLPKGNKKRSRPMTANNAEAPTMNPSMQGSGENLNLASATSTNVRSKSTSKFFEALKENVYMEVSALMETNDLRPYFLIQLFRDLQLMSSSDPTRHHTLQSIQNQYNRYVESTIQEEVTMFGGAQGGQSCLTEEDRQNLSNDEADNRMLVNDLRMEAKTENDPTIQNREGRRRDNQAEDSLRRQNKRRYRNRVNEIANKQNFPEQRLVFNFPSSSASSHSTPVRSVFGVDGSSAEQQQHQFIPQATSSSDSSSISMSTDCEIIRIVVKEIAEYLQSIDTITEAVLQRTATIIISHLNNALNERLLLTNFCRIDRDDLMVQLRMFAGKRSKFLRRIEQYLQGRFLDVEAGKETSNGFFQQGREESMGANGHDVGLENQEVLNNNNEAPQAIQKKQNNEQGFEVQPIKDGAASNSAIEQEEEGATGEVEDNAEMDFTGHLMTGERKENNEMVGEVSLDKEEVGQEDEAIWATDEEVEILSTNEN